jgi:hypothetical protein
VSGDGTPALAAISRWTSVALRWPARRVGRCGQDRRGRSGRGRTLARPGGIAAGDRAAAPFHPCRCGQVGRRAQLPRRSGLASPTHVAGPRCPPVAGASRGCRRPGDVLSWRRAAVLRSPVQLGRSSHRTQGAVQDLPSARGYRLAGGKMAHEPAASGERGAVLRAASPIGPDGARVAVVARADVHRAALAAPAGCRCRRACCWCSTRLRNAAAPVRWRFPRAAAASVTGCRAATSCDARAD